MGGMPALRQDGRWRQGEMITVVDKLPKGVAMAPYFEDKVRRRKEGKRKFKYICILHGGKSFYIPITREVWEAFSLASQLQNQDGDVCWESGTIDKALGIIVGSILLQVRDDILGGMGREILDEVHARIDKAMGEPLMRELHDRASQRMAGLLEAPKEDGNAQG